MSPRTSFPAYQNPPGKGNTFHIVAYSDFTTLDPTSASSLTFKLRNLPVINSTRANMTSKISSPGKADDTDYSSSVSTNYVIPSSSRNNNISSTNGSGKDVDSS